MYSSTRTIDQTIKNVIELRSKNIFTVLYGYFSHMHVHVHTTYKIMGLVCTHHILYMTVHVCMYMYLLLKVLYKIINKYITIIFIICFKRSIATCIPVCMCKNIYAYLI